MEYLSYVESLEDGIPKFSCSFSKVNKEEHDFVEIVDSSEGALFNNDVYSICSSSNDEIYGFDTPKKDKHNYIVNLMKKIEADTSEESFAEKDVIDGIEFLSFSSEQELMDYAKTQLDLRANASDDGLEILDDGTFSDISSNHAIVPTKTKDITRIKGWRNKHFAGINVCDDSGSSLRNDDDGFGDDFEIKSVQDESSEELESVGYAASTTSKSGYEGDATHETNYKRIDSPVIEDTNAVDNAEGFTFKKSNKNLSSGSLSSSTSQKSTASNDLKFSFDNFDIKGIFTSDKLSDISAISDQVSIKKSTDDFLSPLTPQDRKSKHSFDSKVVVYKPRVKQGFLERLARKVSADNFENFPEQTISSLVSNSRVEKGIRWHVPKEKLLSGNIYDVEVSMSCDPKLLDCEIIESDESSRNFSPGSGQKKNKGGPRMVSTNVDIGKENIAAFRSTTLEHYTTNLDKLHIDFTIPKLDAADNVTHEEIVLPVQDCNRNLQQRHKPKLVDEIRPKTVAEKRRLLTEHNLDQRSKRKQKLSFKIRVNNEITHCKRVKRLRGRIEKNTQEAKQKDQVEPLDKKLQLAKVIFDKQGVITYGREKPLKSAFSKSLLAFHKASLTGNFESDKSYLHNSKIGMILNIGVFRPLYKEANDNVNKFALDDDGNITAAYAAFSSSAVQDSRKRPFTVKRILVPVMDDTLKKVMFMSENPKNVVKRKNLKKRFRVGDGKRYIFSDLNLFKEPQGEMSEDTKQFVIDNEIDSDVCDVVSEMLNYVELKEFFQNIDYNYDPDVPIPVEKENVELSTLKTTSSKRKKTKLQRQIERLGGTFIAVQGEEGNEENLAQVQEENKNCLKESCKMGCVCHYRMLREEHCGKEACMLSCQCPPSARRQGCEIKSKIWLLPEVLRHHNVSQSKLAPVEREYHQTVIMSKDKKITIETKHKKRERKLPSKYKDEIMFDYRKGNNHDDEDDDCLLVSVEDEKTLKQNRQVCKEPSHNYKKRQTSPMVPSLETTLMNPTTSHNYGLNIKHCCVQIERNNTINQMAAELNFTPGVRIDNHKSSQSPQKRQSAKKRSRNVARKKTGGSRSHHFDIENFCSRTHGITEDYVLRNFLGKLRTKNFMLYPSVYHGNNNSGCIQPFNNSPIVKEDLVERSSTDTESENEIEEKSPNEEERGLQIKFVHSLPPHLFEEQDQVDQEETPDESKASTGEISSPLLSHIPNNSNKEIVENTKPVGQKRFVYAALPKTENECKWWVVELDSNKFTDLVYYSEKRSLSFSLIKKAIFDAEYNNATIKLVLKNSGSPFEDMFGAYVVGGHKHLIFFGPYELSDTHGLTAIRREDENVILVPFTTKFSKSENFKSLGINMTPMIESCQSLKAANAVWWYSTGKKGTVTNVAENRSAHEKPKSSSFVTSQDENSRSRENEINHGSETNKDNETVGVIEDDITIEHDPIKVEPFDYYENNLSYGSIGENSADANSSNSTIDWHIPNCLPSASQTDSQKSTENIESGTDVVVDTTNSVETPSESKTTPSTNSRSLLKRNVAKMKTASANKISTPPVKKDPPILKKRKRKTLYSRQKKNQKEDLTKEDMQIITLKKKIENLKEVILSKQLKTREDIQISENVPEVDFESDSTSLSDEDLYIDIHPEKSDDIPLPAKKVTNVKRVVHKGPKVAPKSKEQTPGNLPQNLLQRKPREGPCPEKALLSLTPGIGYIPVVEFDPRDGHLVIQDPCNPQLEHLFQNKSLAVDWLNQYFLDRFIFKPKFDMQWLIMTGSIIRKLQPLNKDIFKYKARSLTIRPCGLELGHSILMDQDFVDWERRELSLLRKRIAADKTTINKKNEQHTRTYKKNIEFRVVPDYMLKKPTNHITMEHHNTMERMRRSELAELMANLGRAVWPEDKPSRLAKVGILMRAIYVCEAQKMVEEQLRKEAAELKRKREMLNQRLKSIFADILNHEEKKKALDVCKFIRCNQYKLPDMSDKYLKATRIRENELIASKFGQTNYAQKFRPTSTSSMRSSSSSGSLGSVQGAEPTTPDTAPAPQQGARETKQPSEGVLVKSKLRSLTASRPDLKIYPASLGGDVINLVDDSDEDHQIIEIESEEEDVIWLPAKEQSQQEDDDVEILSSNVKARRPKLKFPKPKRKLPQSSPTQSILNTGRTVDSDISTQPRNLPQSSPTQSILNTGRTVDSDISTQPRNLPQSSPTQSILNTGRTVGSDNATHPVAPEEDVLRTPAESSNRPSVSAPAPVAMVMSPAIMEQHLQATDRAKLQVAPEFVAVAEHDYEPFHCEFESGCSRTDPVADKYRAKLKLACQQFIPIQQTSLVNCMNKNVLKITTNATPPVQRKVMTPFARLQEVKLSNITPIGYIGKNDKLSAFRGRPVLLRKSNEGIQISKIPTSSTPLPHSTSLSATPVTITETPSGVSGSEKVSPKRSNTVTLYHPSEELSVTKTVQFADLNSVQLDMPASSVLSGPKVRKPKDDGSPGSIKIILPKRN